MNAKIFLGQAYRMNLRINCKLEQLEHLRAMAYKVTSVLSQNKVSETKEKSPMENAVIKIIMAEKEIDTDITRFLDTKTVLSKNITLVENEEHRILLELRYLCFNTWEQIAVKMTYSCSYVYKLHACALKSFGKVLEECEKAV